MHQNASPNFSILGKTLKVKGPFCIMQGRELYFGPAVFCLKNELNRHYEIQFFYHCGAKVLPFAPILVTESASCLKRICTVTNVAPRGRESQDFAAGNRRISEHIQNLISSIRFSFTSSVLLATHAAAATFYASNSTTALEELSLSGAYGWSSPQFAPILHTCNETYTGIINAHLQDSLEAAAFARNRLMEYGKDDEIFMRWFGDGSIYEVIGLLDYLVEANKDHISWRCDDISDKCDPNPTWGGYSYEESQNVLCPYFFQERVALSKLCFDGTIVETTPKHYGGIDMLHRYLHLPAMNTEYIQEYYEEIDEILDLAQNNATFATRNVDSYLYYIAEVYAESVVPGGCLGDL
ncbi:hypothetical protein KL930_003084 [Ogataea haglerorum]|nr:hypothetical protein KL947_002528 [Ogataea haglerorum]KAG7773272.1 hypothetical protein KL922_005390 [Ogataea haglerorum]KAG7775962.1 hypothetical protein KL930_003084 [Ogataea haglerorum]